MITADIIESTKAYQSIKDFAQKQIAISKHSRKLINDGYVISSNIGLESWKEKFNPSSSVYAIVSELINK